MKINLNPSVHRPPEADETREIFYSEIFEIEILRNGFGEFDHDFVLICAEGAEVGGSVAIPIPKCDQELKNNPYPI